MPRGGSVTTPRPGDDPSSSSQSADQPNVFKLQLRPVEDPDSFKPNVQLVNREFATRYLEQVGVRPSKATLELVNRNVPLTETHIKTTLRAKGHVEDELHISVPPVTHAYKVPVFINPAAVLQLGMGNSVLGAGPEGLAAKEAKGAGATAGDVERPGSSGSGGGVGGGGGGGEARSPGGSSFLEMAARYLHPFNLDLTLARQNLTALYAAARQRTAAADDAGGEQQGGGDGRANSANRGVRGNSAGDGVSTSGRGSVGYGEGGAAAGQSHRRSGSGGKARSLPQAPVSWPRSASGRLRTPLEHAATQGGGEGEGGGAGGGGGGRARGGLSSQQLPPVPPPHHQHDSARVEVMEELAQPLLVTPEVVLTLQAQLEAALADWHRHQAPEALKGRLSAEEFRRTQEELSSEGMVKVLITLAHFMHEELVRGHPGYPMHMEARLNSREGLRSSQSRRHHDIWEERGLLPRNISSSGGAPGGGGGGGCGGAPTLPASVSTQQMTNLQKYDLGYQAYVRQKLDQRPVVQQGGGAGGGGGGAGGRSGRSGAASPLTGGLGQGHHGGARGQLHSGGGLGPGLSDAQRGVSFAVAPHYQSVPHSPEMGGGGGGVAGVDSPASTHGRNGGGLFGGQLNLPGTLRSGQSSPSRTQHGGASGQHSQQPSAQFSAVAPIPGLPPRVGRALKHSASFALASAANTARTIHASLDAADTSALQRERLFALHVEWAGRFKALRQSRSGMFFTLPILLLSMRLCVNTLFATLYPLWSRMPEGAQVLEDMDTAICALLDPHGYLARALSLLQSTPSAIEAVTRHPQRRGKERLHFNDTSPLMQATLQGAKSAGARKLLQSTANQPSGRGLLRTQLTGEQRAALFARGLQWMSQQDPVLSQVGEPQFVGRLFPEGAS